MTWNKETERFLNDYKNGDIPKMKEELEDLLFPFDFNNLEKISSDWQTINDYELKIEKYNLIALDAGENIDSTIFKQAIHDVMFIKNRVKAKKEFAKELLEKAVIEYQQDFSKQFEENNLKELQKNKESLKKIKKIAEAIDYDGLVYQSTSLETISNKKIEQLLDEENDKKENSLFYENLLKDANTKLRKSTTTKDLETTRQQLYDLSAANDSDDSFDKEKLEKLIGKYDASINNRSSHNKKRNWKLLASGIGLAAILGAGYLSIGLIKDARESMREQVNAKKELAISDLNEEKESYVQNIAALKQEYSTLSSRVENKKGEYDSLRLQEKEENFTKTKNARALETNVASILPIKNNSSSESNYLENNVNLINHLSPLLSKAKFTIYIEKDSNKTYLVENDEHSSEYLLHGPFAHTDASNPERKTRQGQKSTPEGIYSIVNFSYFGDDKLEPFGRGFWKINYPNEKDLQESSTGGGVGLCSAANYTVENAINNGLDVMHSGIAFHDKTFERIKSLIGDGSSAQVIIENYAKRPLAELR